MIEYIIQGGAVGLAAYSLYVLDKRGSAYEKIIGNHIDHSTEAMKELTEVIGQLKEVISGKMKKK